MKKLLTRAICVLPALLLLISCGTDEGYRRQDLPVRPQTGDLQFINLMPDSPAITAAIGNTTTDVEFASASSMLSLTIGDYELSLSYLDADGQPVYIVEREALTLADEDRLVYVLSGSVHSPTVETARFLDPQFGGSIDSDTSEVWFKNALSSDQAVNLYLTEADTTLDGVVPTATVAAGGTTETMQLPYSETMRLRVTPSDSTTLLYDSGSFLLTPASRTLIAVVDYFGPTSATLFTPAVDVVRVVRSGVLTFGEQAVPSQIRLVDLVRDVDSLDVYFGSTSKEPLFSGAAPFVTTPYVDVKAGARALNVTRVGVKDQFIAQDDLDLSSGQFYTLVLSGRASDGTIYPLLAPTPVRQIVDRVRVNFMYAAVEGQNVNMYLLNPGQTQSQATAKLSGVPNKSVRSFTVRPTIFDVIVTTTNSNTVLLGPERVELEQGKSYSLVLLDDVAGDSSSLRLVVLEDG